MGFMQREARLRMVAGLWRPGSVLAHPAGHRGAPTTRVPVTEPTARVEGTDRPELPKWRKQNSCAEESHVRWVAAVPLPPGRPRPAPNVNHHPFPF